MLMKPVLLVVLVALVRLSEPASQPLLLSAPVSRLRETLGHQSRQQSLLELALFDRR